MKAKIYTVTAEYRKYAVHTVLGTILLLACRAQAAIFIKANNTTALNVAASWANNAVPGSGDIAWFDGTFSVANNYASIGASTTWSGIAVSNNLQSGFTVNAAGDNVLTILGGGINLSNANQNFTINCPMTVGASQTWNVNGGETLAFGGGVNAGANSIAVFGAGTIAFLNNYTDSIGIAFGPWYSNTVTISPGANGSYISMSKVTVGKYNNGNATLNIESGSNSFTAGNYFILGDGASGNPGNGTVNITGGQTTIATTLEPIVIGGWGSGTLNVSGGSLMIGTNSIVMGWENAATAIGTLTLSGTGSMVVSNGGSFVLGNNGSSFGTINLYGGTLTSMRNITRGAGTGNIRFSGGTLEAGQSTTNFLQGLTVATVSTNGAVINDGGNLVSISQALVHDSTIANDGGLTKQGTGTLILSGTNTYNGQTTVSAGTLGVQTMNAAAGAYSVSSNATLNVQVISPGTSLGMSSLTLNGGSTVDFDPNSLGNPSIPVINVSGALTPTSTVTINLNTTTLTNGQFTLIKYGSLGGSGFSAFQLGNLAGAGTLINDATNNSIDIILTTLTWDGTVSGNWDIGATANWKTNAYYTQNDGVGPIVIFDDTANGNNTNITLNTTVSPAGIEVNSSLKAYSISGGGSIGDSGSLLKEGSSTLVLAGTNTFFDQFGRYSTLITGGTLQLGNGSSQNGSVAGAINDEAILAVANPNGQTLTNSIAGAGMLIESGPGALTLAGNNTYTGGTTVNGGTLILSAANNVSMGYNNNAGTLQVNALSAGASLAMSELTFGSGNPQLAFNMNYVNLSVPVVKVSGSLMMNGNVTVNATNVAPTGTNIVLQYSSRSGSGSFVAGSLPAGITLVDNTAGKDVLLIYPPRTRVMIPTLNTNEAVVAVATPQDFGAKGDGITDDSAAFQNAMNWAGSNADGGVVFVPEGYYAFYTNLTIPPGVTLNGDWTDWTTGTKGLEGTTFKIYFGAGQTNGSPFIFMSTANTVDGPAGSLETTAINGINFWYPNQNPTNITGYPYTIQINHASVVRDVVLVNSYQGIIGGNANTAPRHVLSTVIGTPLRMGISIDGPADPCHTEDIRFSPNVWPASLLTNAPAVGDPYAAWMRANGEGLQLLRVDGELNMSTYISGYNIGIEANQGVTGAPGATFYEGSVSNCGTALLAQVMPQQSGLQFTWFTLDGDLAVNHTLNNQDATVEFDHCQIIGRLGTAVYSTGSDWHSWMAFQNCTISNTMNLAGPGVFNVVDSSLSGSTNCIMSASATRVAFTGCTFSPVANIVNNGNVSNLLIDARQSISNALPIVYWTNVMNRYAACQPAKTNLYVATVYGAAGNGTNDDTVAIQSALTAAGANGGGIVYLPGGTYHLTNTLTVPGGVELRGAGSLLRCGSPSILEPYGGQGTTNGPPAVVLTTNSGLVGVGIYYVGQGTNIYPYPPAIQGQGPNVYAIAIGNLSLTFYNYVDLDTYTCSNHFLCMVDGWPLSQAFHVGNGSSGTIVDCEGNGGTGSLQQPYAATNSQYFVLGNCTEQLVKDFSINENTFMHCIAENGYGPNLNGIGTYCDGTVQGVVLDAPAGCNINIVNQPMAVFSIVKNGYLTNATVGVISTTNFQGKARFFNTALFGGPKWDFVVNGGDVGFDEVHMLDHAYNGSVANGGAFHLINNGAFITYNGASDFPPYNITFGPQAGISGVANEFIGCYAYNGCTFTNDHLVDPINVWNDYALSSYSLLDSGVVSVDNIYPNGLYQFEPSSGLNFVAYSPYGIDPSSISVALAQTNLLGQGQSMTYTTANGLVVSGTNVISVTAPLVTNMVYNAVIRVIDTVGNAATKTSSFDTVSPAMTFEAEDFDYNGGSYLSNPAPDAYVGLSGIGGVDYSNGVVGQGTATYRPQGLETETASDKPRLYYDGLADYDTGNADIGNWGNYTRSFPAGSYYVFIRVASPNIPEVQVIGLSQVTSGWGTSAQTTAGMGTFSYQDTGSWQTYVWMPLLDSNGQPFVFQGGSTKTLRATELKTGCNINYYMLVSTNSSLTPSQGQTTLQLSDLASPTASSLKVAWPGRISDIMTNLYGAPSLTPPITWTLVTNAATYTNGQWIVTLPVGTNNSEFYELRH